MPVPPQQAEALSSLRKKEERVAAHAEAALAAAQRPVPAELCALLGRLTRSRRLCAKALHTEPWAEGAWGLLGSCAE